MALAACADFQRGPSAVLDDAGVEPTPSDGGATSFAIAVEPVLIDTCLSCHRVGGVAAGTSLVLSGEAGADFAQVSALVDLATPSASRLLSKAAGQGHGGGAVLAPGSPDYQALLQWVTDGAHP